jgi:hypothetical protein
MWTMTQSPLNAPNEPTDITVHFEKGIPSKLVTPEKTYTDSVELFTALNKLASPTASDASTLSRTASSASSLVAATTRPP